MDDIIKAAQERYQRDESSWSVVYRAAKDDVKFLSDDKEAQWDSADYTNRVNTGRPVITVDHLNQFVHQVANDIRMNTPTINVIPGDREASVEVADVYKGLIRNIEYVSNADDAYDTAALNSVKCSIGFIRVDHDYADDTGFEQELRIKRVINPFACYLDGDSIEADGKDAKHATILDKIKVSEFKKKHPGKDPVSFDAKDTIAKDDEEILIAEHFFLEETDRVVTQDQTGKLVDYIEGMEGPRRTIKKTVVKRLKLSGADILEETTFPGKYIPLVPVYGEEAWNDGKRHLHSLIRKSKDAQRMLNLWKSLETELLMKQPNAPVMAAAGSVENYKEDWTNPAKSMVLRYDTVDVNGNQLPKPERLAPPTVPSGVINASRESVDDVKATMGMYGASIGERTNETSGIAIERRNREGDVATYHFGDNLVRSITQVGRILVCAIPEIYDTPRIIRIMGEEDEPKSVGINGELSTEGESYDLAQGKYDVRVVTGAPFTTARQETVATLTEMFKAQPELMQVMGDLYFKYSDFSGASAMESRMKKAIDPKYLEPVDREKLQQEGQMDDPEKAQMEQVIQQGAQELQQLQQELNNAHQKLEAAKTEADITQAQYDLKIQQEALKAQERENALRMQLLTKDFQLASAQQRPAAQELSTQA